MQDVLELGHLASLSILDDHLHDDVLELLAELAGLHGLTARHNVAVWQLDPIFDLNEVQSHIYGRRCNDLLYGLEQRSQEVRVPNDQLSESSAVNSVYLA